MTDIWISLRQAFLIVLDHLEKVDGTADSERLGDPRSFMGVERQTTSLVVPTGPEFKARYTRRRGVRPRDFQLPVQPDPNEILPLHLPRVPTWDELSAMLVNSKNNMEMTTRSEIIVCKAHKIISSYILDERSPLRVDFYVYLSCKGELCIK